MSLVKNDACACSFCNSGGGGVEDQNMAKSLTTQPFNAPSQAALVSSDARCSTPCRFDSGLVDQDLRECCNACLFTSVGRGKRPNRGHDGGRPPDHLAPESTIPSPKKSFVPSIATTASLPCSETTVTFTLPLWM